MGYTDVHCHILPGVDDGSRDAETSLSMLRTAYDSGITGMFLTPHYYPTESSDEFLSRRKAAYDTLVSAIGEDKGSYPSLHLGAEVYYHVGIANDPNIRELCYEGTDFLLIELPWRKWQPTVFDDVEMLIRYKGITPVIAHLERYYGLTDKRDIKRLRTLDVLVQMNAETIIEPKTRKKALKAIKKKQFDLLGSDAHDPKDRRVNLAEAYAILLENGMSDDAERLSRNARMLLGKE